MWVCISMRTSSRASERCERHIALEVRVLEHLADARVVAFSLHNPMIADVAFQATTSDGLVNASDPKLREEFIYCSDSNGVWRHRRLDDVIADRGVRKLYALTDASGMVTGHGNAAAQPDPAKYRGTGAAG
jgi:hypothetical protein